MAFFYSGLKGQGLSVDGHLQQKWDGLVFFTGSENTILYFISFLGCLSPKWLGVLRLKTNSLKENYFKSGGSKVGKRKKEKNQNTIKPKGGSIFSLFWRPGGNWVFHNLFLSSRSSTIS